MRMKNSLTINSQPIWRLRPGERTVLLIIGDLFIAFLSLFIALYVWSLFDAWLDFSLEFLREKTPVWYYFLPFLWVILLVEIYETRRAGKKTETFWTIMVAALIGFGLYLIVYFTTDPANPLPRIAIALFIPLCALLTLAWRYIYINLFTTSIFMRRVLLVGAGKAGQELARTINEIRPAPFLLVGFLDDDPEKQGLIMSGYPVLGDHLILKKIIDTYSITDIISAISNNIHPELLQGLITAEEKGVEVTTMPVVYEELTGRVPIKYLNSDWLLRTFFDQAHVSESYGLMKRLIDILFSLVGSVVFAITFPFIAIGILIDTPGPIFLRQERIGKNGKPYTIIKYRSMIDNRQNTDVKPTVINDNRITRSGKFLRKSHLDELPQVLNILKNEMSIVGPRAEITQLVALFEQHIPFYRSRLMVKPGLTGWAQIHQAYASTIDETCEKLEYDLYYIKHRTFLFDLHIMVRTISQVLGFRGR